MRLLNLIQKNLNLDLRKILSKDTEKIYGLTTIGDDGLGIYIENKTGMLYSINSSYKDI